ncbi:MAG: glycosyltransferase family 4 protein [Myxococcota bacterium]
MRILHISADWKWTGPAEPMLHAVTGLRERGHATDVAFPSAPAGEPGALEERARERGVAAVHLLRRRRGYVPLRDGGEVRRLRAVLRRGDYHVVHAHHTRDQLLVLRASRGLPLRRVASWHSGEPIPERLWDRLRFGPRALSGLVVLSPRLAAAARSAFGWEPARVGVVRGCVDADRFRPREPAPGLRAKLGIGGDERVLGVVARLQPHRRFDLLLEAFRRARERAPGLRLVVVGRGTRAAQVVDEPVRRLGLGAAVIRAGYRRDDYSDLISLLDVLVFLVPGSDGSCRAVLEAMSMEVPVISSRRGMLPEIVRDGETGLLVDEDPEALAAAMCDVRHDPARWRSRGEAARAAVLENHTVQRHAEDLEKFYASLCAG